jgi:LPS-assembly lipoprotein
LQTNSPNAKAKSLKTLQVLLTTAACLWLAACGFALRGSTSLATDIQPVFISAERDSQELAQSLKRQFVINNVAVAKRRSEAKLIVVVQLLDEQKRSAALDDEARDAEYALYESARLELLSPAGKNLKGPHTLQQRRLIVNDPDNPVGEETESTIVRAEMREQLSIRLARQVEYWSHQMQAQP